MDEPRHSREPAAAASVRVPAAAELGERESIKFAFERNGFALTGILARHDGRLVAYVNRCCHQPLPLDWDDGRFYDREREYFICSSHGATYRPADGLCVAGPCAGDVLEALPLRLDGADAVVTIAEPDA